MSQLLFELNQFPNIFVRKKKRIFGYLTDLGAEAIQDIDYDMRQAYIGKLQALKGNDLRKEYLEILDAIKLAAIQAEENRNKYQTIKYTEQKLFLLYFPNYKIARSFDAEEDQKILLWDFGNEASKRFKRQIFNLLMHIVKSGFEADIRREKYLIPLKLLYEYGLQHDIKDLKLLTKNQEETFLWFIIDNHPLRYEEVKRFISFCRRFLFVYRGRVYWNSYVWYIEELHLHKSRGTGEVTKIKFSFLDLSNEHKDILQGYIKYLIKITDVSISSFRNAYLTIKAFLLFLESEGKLITNSHNIDIKEFFLLESEKGNAPSTFNQKVREIRIFLEYLNTHKQVTNLFVLDEYYYKITGVNYKKSDVSQDEIHIFMDNLKCLPEKLWLMCFILLFTGIQKDSLFHLKACDLLFVEGIGYLNVYSTRKRSSRELPIPDVLYDLMKGYILDQRIDQDAFIFQNKMGVPYNAALFQKLIVRQCEGMRGLQGKYVFKGIEYRKWTARYLHQNGLSLQVIREYLGLKNDKLVEKYIQLNQNLIDQHNESYYRDKNNNLAAGIIPVRKGLK